MPRKHLIASGINKKQQQQAKVWMKCAKEIKAAAKVGGPNPEANPRLKAAIDRALQANLSRESIQKNIQGANKDTNKLSELIYEGYGPNGLAIMIKVLTDNENRSISSLRGYFSKLKGQISKPNSVKMIFSELGQIVIEKTKASYDNLLELISLCPNLQSDDIVDFKDDDENAFELLTSISAFYIVKDYLIENNIELYSAEIKMIPNSSSLVNINQEQYALLERFINSCEDDDDVQWVVHNLNEVLE